MPAALATSSIEGFYCYIYNQLDQVEEWCARPGRRGPRRPSPTRHSSDDHEITDHEMKYLLSRYHANESLQDPMACDASNASTDNGASSDTRNGEPMHDVHDEVRRTQGAHPAPMSRPPIKPLGRRAVKQLHENHDSVLMLIDELSRCGTEAPSSTTVECRESSSIIGLRADTTPPVPRTPLPRTLHMDCQHRARRDPSAFHPRPVPPLMVTVT